jgi:hypothetical protein
VLAVRIEAFPESAAGQTANATGIGMLNLIFSLLCIEQRVQLIMRTSFCFSLCVVLLAGCSNYRQTHLKSGEVGYDIKCSDFGSRSWNACYVMAGDICGNRGYEVVSKVGDSSERYAKHLWIKCN